jgi:hypothetical protein
MRHKRRVILLLCASLLTQAAGRDRTTAPLATAGPSICHVSIPSPTGVPETLAGWAQGAQLFDGLGNRTRAITTTSARAQTYFDQGIAWLWAYNHDEATRSFARAAALDPGCAMCFWGVALTIGPNYNLNVMSDPRGRVAYAALRQAQALAPRAAPVEQALIAALAARYPNASKLDDAAFEKVQIAYAGAMRDVAARFPDDMDVQTLTAEAVMTTNAWKLWTLDGKPAALTPEILARLQAILKRDPQHPGANHYYIHALEASPHPELAEAAADRLRGMIPGAGHLEHMPSHIYQRIGRYEDSAEANRRGTAADLAYFKRTAPLDYYSGYTAHNFQFEALGAAMEGRLAEALRAMDGAQASLTPEDMKGGLGWLQGQRYAYLLRYGKWRQMLELPAPDAANRSLMVAWLWAHGTAQAATGQVAAALATLARLQASGKSLDAKDSAGFDKTSDVQQICEHLLRARIAQAANQPATELSELRAAVTAEDKLAYSEPPTWFTPTRQMLGAALLRNGQPAAAERIYREDLARTPENGFSLLGLAQSLTAQGTPSADINARFARAWSHADTKLSASAL